MTEQKMITRIEALLERARHESTGAEEAAACQEKAEALMQKHRIDMAKLDLEDNKSGRKIESARLERLKGMFMLSLEDMRGLIFEHCGCMIHRVYDGTMVVGYTDDIRYAEMLWSVVQLDFSSKMLPKWSPHRTFDHNVYLLKEAGKSWMEIVWEAPPAEGLNKNSGGRLRSAYASWASKIGAPVKAQPRNPKKWREGFLESYVTTLVERLWAMKAKADMENPPGKTGEIALQRDQDRIKAEFWKLFPKLHPDYIKEQTEAERKRRQEWWDGLTPEQQKRELDADRKLRARYNRAYEPRKTDPDGWIAGRKAAMSLDLSAKGGRIGNDRGREVE